MTSEIRKANFVQTTSRPKDAVGPCDWYVENWSTARDRAVRYASGTCRTCREGRMIVGKVARAMERAYRLGAKHGRMAP